MILLRIILKNKFIYKKKKNKTKWTMKRIPAASNIIIIFFLIYIFVSVFANFTDYRRREKTRRQD